MNNHLFQLFDYSVIIFVLCVIYVYTNLVIFTGLFVVLFILYILSPSLFDYDDLSVLDNNELENFLTELGHKDFELRVTNGESGFVIQRIGNSTIYAIPENLIESNKIQVIKSILSHEYSHVNNYDKLTMITITAALIYVSVILSSLLPILMIPIISLGSSVVINILTNAYNQKLEFRADQFAARTTSQYIVINRLRRNSHRISDGIPYIPFSVTHPRISDRIKNVQNIED